MANSKNPYFIVSDAGLFVIKTYIEAKCINLSILFYDNILSQFYVKTLKNRYTFLREYRQGRKLPHNELGKWRYFKDQK